MYQSTGVPRGVKGVQPPLNVFNCMFAQKCYTTSASVFIRHIIDQRKLLFLRRLVHTKKWCCTNMSWFVCSFCRVLWLVLQVQRWYQYVFDTLYKICCGWSFL